MNQIISQIENKITINYKFNKYKRFFKVLFLFCSFSFIFIFLYLLFFYFNLFGEENISKDFIKHSEITKIYNKQDEYHTTSLNNNRIFFYENNSFSIIGKITIKELDISYPILSDVSKEFLKIAPCRFYGPEPNKPRKYMYCCAQL